MISIVVTNTNYTKVLHMKMHLICYRYNVRNAIRPSNSSNYYGGLIINKSIIKHHFNWNIVMNPSDQKPFSYRCNLIIKKQQQQQWKHEYIHATVCKVYTLLFKKDIPNEVYWLINAAASQCWRILIKWPAWTQFQIH